MPPRQIFFRWDFFVLWRRSTLAALAALPARSEELIFLMERRPVSDAEVQQQQNEDNIQRPFQELSQFLSFSRQIKRFFRATSPFRNVIFGGESRSRTLAQLPHLLPRRRHRHRLFSPPPSSCTQDEKEQKGKETFTLSLKHFHPPPLLRTPGRKGRKEGGAQ